MELFCNQNIFLNFIFKGEAADSMQHVSDTLISKDWTQMNLPFVFLTLELKEKCQNFHDSWMTLPNFIPSS